MRRSLPAFAAGALWVVLWSSAFVGIPAAGDEFSPGPLALGRVVIASVALGLVVRRLDVVPRCTLSRRDGNVSPS